MFSIKTITVHPIPKVNVVLNNSFLSLKFFQYKKGKSSGMPIAIEDVKDIDGTPEESKMYDERCKRISTQMLYLLFSIKLVRIS